MRKNLFRQFLGLPILGGVLLTAACSSSDSLTIKGSTSATAQFADLQIMKPLDMRAAVGYGSPTSLNISLYAVWLSTNADCSSPVFGGGSETAATAQNFFDNPTLVTGSPAAGTYNCIILKMKDVLTFKADAKATDGTNAGCTSTTTEYSFDIYRNGATNWRTKDGGVITGNGQPGAASADDVFIYVTTTPSAPTSGAIGASSEQVVTLTSPLVVPGTGTMTIDSSNGVASNNGHCWLEKATFGFR